MKRLVVLFLWLTGMGLAADAMADVRSYDMAACKEIMAQNPAKIDVKYTFNQLNYDFSLSEKQLEDFFQEVNPDQPLTGKVLGMNRLIPGYTISTYTMPYVLDSGQICHIPAEVAVKIFYDNPTIFVANSLDKNSCRFKMTLRHEQAHADVGYSAMMLLVRSLRNQMPKIVQEIGPSLSNAENVGNVAQKMNDDYVRRTTYIFQIFKDTLMEQQARYDSEQNYLNESKLCSQGLL